MRALIREGKTPQVLNFLQTGSKSGMNTLEQKLVELIHAGLITAEEGISKANRPDDVRRDVSSMTGGIQGSPTQGSRSADSGSGMNEAQVRMNEEMAGMYGNGSAGRQEAEGGTHRPERRKRGSLFGNQ